MAQYLAGAPGAAKRVGVLPSAFNPPTIAHLALAASAQARAGLHQVVFALPRELPHKPFSGATLEQRIRMLQAAIEGRTAQAAALTDGGLFIEIAREFKEICASGVEIFLICGRDAAERIASWDYGSGPAFEKQLDEFSLVVGDRSGPYLPGVRDGRILAAPLPQAMSEVSSRSLRARRAAGAEWRSLTAPTVAALIEEWGLYLDRPSEP